MAPLCTAGARSTSTICQTMTASHEAYLRVRAPRRKPARLDTPGGSAGLAAHLERMEEEVHRSAAASTPLPSAAAPRAALARRPGTAAADHEGPAGCPPH